jgi:A/G-specific adenine glycosylase
MHRWHRAVIVDANVSRWLSRMTGNPYQRDPRHVRWINELADRLTPRRVFRDYNYAVLDFTLTVCTPRNPACQICPLRRDCSYGQQRFDVLADRV